MSGATTGAGQVRVTFELGGKAFPAVPTAVRRAESLGAVGEYRVAFAWAMRSSAPMDHLRAAVGSEATITFDRRGATTRLRGRVRRAIADDRGIEIVVAGPAFALDQGEGNAAYMAISDLAAARQEVQAFGRLVALRVHAAPPARPLIRRQEESKLAFLCRLARRNGWVVYESDGSVVIADAADGDVQQLSPADLAAGSGTIDVSIAPWRFQGRSLPYDPYVTSTATSDRLPTGSALLDVAAHGSELAVPHPGNCLHEDGAKVQELLDLEMQARTRGVAATMAVFKAVVTDPSIGTGSILRHPDPDFVADELCVVAVDARCTPGHRYEANITAVPRPAFSMPARNGEPRRPTSTRHAGLALARVVDADDRDGLGRVQVELRDGTAARVWVRVAVAAAGAEHGNHWTPRPGAEVVVGFLGGDGDEPLLLGCLYHRDAPPDCATPNGAREVLLLRTSRDTVIRTEETGDGERIVITQGKDNRIELDTSGDGPRVLVETAGQLHLRADAAVLDARQIRITASEELAVTAPRTTVDASDGVALSVGKFRVESKGDIELEGGDVSVTASGDLELSGNDVEVSGSGETSVTGSKIEIEARSSVKVSGKPIELN